MKKLGAVLLMVCFIFTSVVIQVFAAGIGEVLKEPENGWKRYNLRMDNIKAIGRTKKSTTSTENLTVIAINDYDLSNSKAIIKIEASKIRIICMRHTAITDTAKSDGYIKMKVDGVDIYTSTDKTLHTVQEYSHLMMEVNLGEEIAYHEIEIYPQSGKTMWLESIDIDEDGKLLDPNTPVDVNIIDIESEKETIKQSETVSANLVIDNINEIVAEDIRINYDEEKLEFLGFEEVDGMKLIKSVEETADGDLRVIVASKGESNIINAKEVLLKLKFKGIGTGEALVDITNGRVTDGIELEKDLDGEECGEATILIEGMKDVNNSGEFTLLDLGIDARHLSKDPASSELTEYNTDIVVNGEIDDEDLLEIGRLILENPNYTPNN